MTFNYKFSSRRKLEIVIKEKKVLINAQIRRIASVFVFKFLDFIGDFSRTLSLIKLKESDFKLFDKFIFEDLR